MDTALLNQFSARKIAVLQDDSSPEKRAVLVSPAEDISAATVNTLLEQTGGHIFVALNPTRAHDFALQGMSEPRRFQLSDSEVAVAPLLEQCTSVEAREGVSTGISAPDRAATISLLGAPVPDSRTLVRPGHVFPVVVREGGVLVKNALPEGALDLVRLINCNPAAAFIDLLDQDGNLLEESAQQRLATEKNWPMFTLSELIRHRLETEQLVYKVAEARLPTRLAGELRSCIYKSRLHDGEHLALVKGEIRGDEPVLTRVQAESTFADVFGGPNPPSRRTIQQSLQAIGERGRGVLIYLRSPDTGRLQEQVARSQTTPDRSSMAVMREYGLGAQILRDLGVRKIELLTHSSRNLVGLHPFGLEIVSQRPLSDEHETGDEGAARE